MTLKSEEPNLHNEDLMPIREQPLGAELRGGALMVPSITAEEFEEGVGPYKKSLVRVQATEGVSMPVFRMLLSSAYTQYLMEHRISIDRLHEWTKHDLDLIGKVVMSPEFDAALKTRGVETDLAALTPEMDLALLIILDPHDGLTMQRKLKKASVTSTKYQAWMRNPAFKARVTSVSEALVANSSEALTQLAAQVGAGNLHAIKYQLELNNRYNPRSEAVMDMAVFMQSMLEIISRNVTEPTVLTSISRDMRKLLETSGGADVQIMRNPGTGLLGD